MVCLLVDGPHPLRLCYAFIKGFAAGTGSFVEISSAARLLRNKPWMRLQPVAILCCICRYNGVRLCSGWATALSEYVWVGSHRAYHGLVVSIQSQKDDTVALVLFLPDIGKLSKLYFRQSTEKTFDGLGSLRSALSVLFHLSDPQLSRPSDGLFALIILVQIRFRGFVASAGGVVSESRSGEYRSNSEL